VSNLATLFVLFVKTNRFYRRIMVVLESVVSGHQFNAFRDRLADKLEIIRFDPYSECRPSLTLCICTDVAHVSFSVQQESLYRERKKIRSA